MTPTRTPIPRSRRTTYLIVETELASTLKVLERQGNTLSPVIRNAWDGTTLSTLTRNARLKATGAQRLADRAHHDRGAATPPDREAASGFGNRFLWVCVRRSKLLPEGATVPQHELNELSRRLRSSLDHALRAGAVERDKEARALWADTYERLTRGHGGLVGALTTGAEAQVTRLSLLYALLDGADAIRAEHLRSALAVWDYAERSVLHIFGDSTGNPEADAILRALQATPSGLTRTEISNLFGRNVPAARIDRALTELLERSLAFFEKESTGGRPGERWHYRKESR